MTCQWEIGETYTMRSNTRCANCGWSFHVKAEMVYTGHRNVIVFEGHTYYGDCFDETPPIHCPNCSHTTGKFSIPCPEGLGDELFEVASVPVEAISK